MSRVVGFLGGTSRGADTGEASRRLAVAAYACMAAGLVLYVLAIWGEAYLDTRHAATVACDRFSESHRHWRLRSTLVFLIWSVLGVLTLPFGFGWLIVIPAYAWYVYRIAKGLVYFWRREPIGVGTRTAKPGFAD